MSKKVRELFRGVVFTGAAVGGVSILNDADLAYAMESEQVLEEVAKGEFTVEVANEVDVVNTVLEQAEVSETAETALPGMGLLIGLFGFGKAKSDEEVKAYN